MLMKNLISAIMIFVTDCDNTLVHYADKATAAETITSMQTASDLIDLPPSSGSGKLAIVSRLTIQLLNEIEIEITKQNGFIICATGMRPSTMYQRQSLFPSIKYWACENGGRIFYREIEGSPPIEIKAYSEGVLQRSTTCRSDLEEFAELLKNEGWHVDSNGYLTMVRVKGEGLDQIVSRIPSTLSHTFNLGYLDIQIKGCGKLNAVKWILKNCLSKTHQQIQNLDSKISDFSSNDNDNHPQSQESCDLPLLPSFLFMGDDDNDIEISRAAASAYITKPCSTAMQKYIDSEKLEKQRNVDSNRIDQSSIRSNSNSNIKQNENEKEEEKDDVEAVEETIRNKKRREETEKTAENIENTEEFQDIYEAPYLRHRGTEALLALVLKRVKIRNNNDSV